VRIALGTSAGISQPSARTSEDADSDSSVSISSAKIKKHQLEKRKNSVACIGQRHSSRGEHAAPWLYRRVGDVGCTRALMNRGGRSACAPGLGDGGVPDALWACLDVIDRG